MTEFPPERCLLRAIYLDQQVGDVLSEVGRVFAASFLQVSSFSYTDHPKEAKGGIAELSSVLSPEVEFIALTTPVGRVWIDKQRDAKWEVSVAHPDTHELTSEWFAKMLALAIRTSESKLFVRAELLRVQSSSSSFVPEPPIAGANHLVITTDAEVAAAYDDPSLFWKVWDEVKPLGAFKLCTRAVNVIDEAHWLAYTFESTMMLVRNAKPKLTVYNAPYWEPEFAAWWEFGNHEDEKAGNPALAPIGYNEEDDCYHFMGFITNTPIEKMGPEPRHVLIREIYMVRKLARGKKDPKGRPIKDVKITFPEKWMAEQEKRPLLDGQARVFYGDGIEITE